jgi:LPXTG-motif cell wall-anchored protein
MKSTRVFAAALLLAGGAVAFSTAPAYAEDVPPHEQVCDGLDSGKEDLGDGNTTFEIFAPEGTLITGYCVKAGSENQEDGGPEYVTVDPPAESVVISHSTGKDISHYSFSWEKITTTPPSTPPVTTPPVTTPPETTHTTPPAGGGDGEGKELAETGFDNGWLLFAGIGAIALGGAIAAPRIAAAKRR